MGSPDFREVRRWTMLAKPLEIVLHGCRNRPELKYRRPKKWSDAHPYSNDRLHRELLAARGAVRPNFPFRAKQAGFVRHMRRAGRLDVERPPSANTCQCDTKSLVEVVPTSTEGTIRVRGKRCFARIFARRVPRKSRSFTRFRESSTKRVVRLSCSIRLRRDTLCS
jgi:hypothetical protein